MNHRRRFRLLMTLLLAVLVAVSGCRTGDDTAQNEEPTADEQVPGEREHAPHQRPMDRQRMMEMCPMGVENTSMSLERGEDGVAVDFTTDGDVDELRDRVEQMAQRHNQGMMHHRDDDRGRMHGRDDRMPDDRHHRRMHGEMMHIMAETTAETEEIDNGMRMWLLPDDPEQVDELYELMQDRMQMMTEHGDDCPMMQMMGDEMPGGEMPDEQHE